MNNLTRFDNDGLELVIDTKTGEAYATQSGYARMSGISLTGVAKRLEKLVNQNEAKKAEINTGYGFKVVNLIPAKLVFKWLMTDRLELAEKMGEVGATVYLHQVAGFKVNSSATTETPKIESVKLLKALPLEDLKFAMPSAPAFKIDHFLLDRLEVHRPEFKEDIKAARTFLDGLETASKCERLHPCLPLNADLLEAVKTTSESTVGQFIKKDLMVTNARRRSELLPILRAFAVQHRLPLA